MNNFAPIKVGGWTDEDPLEIDQLNQIQEDLIKAPNFAEGGKYSPTDSVEVDGEHGFAMHSPVALYEGGYIGNNCLSPNDIDTVIPVVYPKKCSIVDNFHATKQDTIHLASDYEVDGNNPGKNGVVTVLTGRWPLLVTGSFYVDGGASATPYLLSPYEWAVFCYKFSYGAYVLMERGYRSTNKRVISITTESGRELIVSRLNCDILINAANYSEGAQNHVYLRYRSELTNTSATVSSGTILVIARARPIYLHFGLDANGQYNSQVVPAGSVATVYYDGNSDTYSLLSLTGRGAGIPARRWVRPSREVASTTVSYHDCDIVTARGSFGTHALILNGDNFTPDGAQIQVVANDGGASAIFNVSSAYNGVVGTTVYAVQNAVTTFLWRAGSQAWELVWSAPYA